MKSTKDQLKEYIKKGYNLNQASMCSVLVIPKEIVHAELSVFYVCLEILTFVRTTIILFYFEFNLIDFI